MTANAPLVVHVIYELGTGGLENGLVNLINRSPRSRYRHAIICLTRSGAFETRIEGDDVPVYALHKKPGNDPLMFLRLYRLLRRLRPAVVHTRNLAALETQVLGLLMPRVRRVHGEHGRDVSDLDGSNVRYRRLRRILAPLIHRFICVSEDLARWLRDDVGIQAGKIVQIYNGVDHEKFAHITTDHSLPPAGFLPADGALVLGTVGRLAAVKDQRRLLCAVQHILQRRPALGARLRVIVVGDGPLRGELEAQAAAMPGMVWFAGDRSDVPALLALMDVFVLPSLGEGISNTILEAMSGAHPVVASDVGGNPELVEDGATGLLFPVGDGEALADALMTLLDDPERCTAMGDAGRRRVQARHDWDRTVAAYLGVYDAVLAGHRPATPPPPGGKGME